MCHVLCCILMWKVFQSIINDKNKTLLISQDADMYKKSCNNQESRRKKWWMDTAYLSTLLFAVHPVHVEAVCGVVGRADLLAAITFFLAFLIYKKSLTSHKYRYIYLLSSVIISGISMLCKENGITVLVCIYFIISNKMRLKQNLCTV